MPSAEYEEVRVVELTVTVLAPVVVDHHIAP